MRLGVQNAAETARAVIRRRFPSLRQLDAGQVLTMLRQGEPAVYVAGEPCDVRAELQTALSDTASAILAQVLPRWERTASAERTYRPGRSLRRAFRPPSGATRSSSRSWAC